MKYSLNIIVSLGLSLIYCIADAQTTPIDNAGTGPHIFFEARNRHSVLTDSGLEVTFDLYMSASQSYINYVKSSGDGDNGPQFGLESADVAFDIDFGAAMEIPFVLPNGNSIVIKSNQLSGAQAQTNVRGSSPTEYDTRFKYSVFRESDSEPLSPVPTLVASVSLFWAPELVGAGYSPNNAKIQLRCAATGFGTGLSGSKWADFTGNAKNIIGSSEATKPLPVTLVSFNASEEGNTIVLNWKTSEETNSKHFEVQRSINGKNWKTVEIVAALAESEAEHTYYAVDADPLNGENLYRLHMVDQDGSSAFSKVISIRLRNKRGVYPNPTSGILNLDAAGNLPRSAALFDLRGNLVAAELRLENNKVDLRDMPPGLYVLKITHENATESIARIAIER